MAKGKPPFAPTPARAIRPLNYFNKERQRDEELTALDLRVLMAIGWHDRLSTSKGSPGCYASNELMAAELGCTVQSLSRSIAHLIAAGLIERDRSGVPGKRHLTVYRVIYDPADVGLLAQSVAHLGRRQRQTADQSFTPDRPNPLKSVTQAEQKTLSRSETSFSQETSLREGIDSSEDVERKSSEEARFARGSSGKLGFADNLGAHLSTLERALKSGSSINAPAWEEYLDDIVMNSDDNALRGQAERLHELVIEALTEDEYAQWGLKHGWVDENGKWVDYHPRAAA